MAGRRNLMKPPWGRESSEEGGRRSLKGLSPTLKLLDFILFVVAVLCSRKWPLQIRVFNGHPCY